MPLDNTYSIFPLLFLFSGYQVDVYNVIECLLGVTQDFHIFTYMYINELEDKLCVKGIDIKLVVMLYIIILELDIFGSFSIVIITEYPDLQCGWTHYY